MELVRQREADGRSGTRAIRNGIAATLAAVLSALAVATLVWLLLAGAGARPIGSQASSVDPFVQPAAVEFRRGEREAGRRPVDPFVQPAAIEFRRSERER